MYSKEFMKFLFGYQKDDCCKKEPMSYQVRFKKNCNGKPAKVYVVVENK
ncbi:hypothetical protein IJ674_09075 [bacterium]|jgi:hypothetical protein|nr:hypothetical protein [bacterium]